MKITKVYCDKCFKEIDTKQRPNTNSDGSFRNFKIMRTDLVSIYNGDSEVLLCDDCYNEIEAILTDKQIEEKSKAHYESPFDDDSQPEKPIVTCDMFGQEIEVMR